LDDILTDITNITPSNDYEPTDIDFESVSEEYIGYEDIEIDGVTEFYGVTEFDGVTELIDKVDEKTIKPDTVNILTLDSTWQKIWDDTLWVPSEPTNWQSTGFEPNQSAIWDSPLTEIVPDPIIVSDPIVAKADPIVTKPDPIVTKPSTVDPHYAFLRAAALHKSLKASYEEVFEHYLKGGNYLDFPKRPKVVASDVDVEVVKPTEVTEVPTQVSEVPTPRVLHKAKKGHKLTEEQKAENKSIKRAEFLSSPACKVWLAQKWMDELSTLNYAKTDAEKDQILERFRCKGLKQAQFIDSFIEKYEPSSSPMVGGYLADWVERNPILASAWASENPQKAKETETRLEESMARDELPYKGPYFKV
jgi:hypothetical protein